MTFIYDLPIIGLDGADVEREVHLPRIISSFFAVSGDALGT